MIFPAPRLGGWPLNSPQTICSRGPKPSFPSVTASTSAALLPTKQWRTDDEHNFLCGSTWSGPANYTSPSQPHIPIERRPRDPQRIADVVDLQALVGVQFLGRDNPGVICGDFSSRIFPRPAVTADLQSAANRKRMQARSAEEKSPGLGSNFLGAIVRELESI